MADVIPARAAAEQIQRLRKYGCVTLTDDMERIISEHMRERDTAVHSWRSQLLDAWRNDNRATMTALLEGGPERRNP